MENSYIPVAVSKVVDKKFNAHQLQKILLMKLMFYI